VIYLIHTRILLGPDCRLAGNDKLCEGKVCHQGSCSKFSIYFSSQRKLENPAFVQMLKSSFLRRWTQKTLIALEALNETPLGEQIIFEMRANFDQMHFSSFSRLFSRLARGRKVFCTF